MPSTIRFLACVAAGLLLASCATFTPPQTEFSAEFPFETVTTFIVLPVGPGFGQGDPGAALRVGKPMSDEIRRVLLEGGLTEASLEEADIAVRVGGDTTKEIDVQDWGYRPYGFGPGRPTYSTWGPGYRDITVTEREESHLSVEAFNTGDKQLVWVGWVRFAGNYSNVPVEKLVPTAGALATELLSKIAGTPTPGS